MATAKAPANRRQIYDPALAALQPALSGTVPVAFHGQSAREILRGLDMARGFKLAPIITSAHEADQVVTDLKSANARVIVSLNYPSRPQNLASDADDVPESRRPSQAGIDPEGNSRPVHRQEE